MGPYFEEPDDEFIYLRRQWRKQMLRDALRGFLITSCIIIATLLLTYVSVLIWPLNH